MNNATNAASRPQRIAIVGSGISGLTTARLLARRHDVTVFEAADWIGGHTHTVDVHVAGRDYAIDTGFIVCNDWTYPNFFRLLESIGVQRLPSEMGFSVHCERTGIEWAGGSLGQVFAQKRNLLRPDFWRMLTDILRFNREAPRLLESAEGEITLGEYLAQHNYSPLFRDNYVVAMGAAIWSTSEAQMLAFPAKFFVRFFLNHGLLSVSNRPQWYVIRGGSREYIGPLTATFAEAIRCHSPVRRVRRAADGGVFIHTDLAGEERFDAVVFACHSDQALALLGGDASSDERAVLGALPYQENDVVLHTDTRLLPANRKTWSSWNHWISATPGERVQLTYNMNILQGIRAPETFCVTLNQTQQIDPARVLGRYTYHHPVFTLDGVAAQQRWELIDGKRNTHFCGAYWRNGFHEDGVWSALRVAQKFGETL
jgi:predicted NAD/FAD-binding protein